MMCQCRAKDQESKYSQSRNQVLWNHVNKEKAKKEAAKVILKIGQRPLTNNC